MSLGSLRLNIDTTSDHRRDTRIASNVTTTTVTVTTTITATMIPYCECQSEAPEARLQCETGAGAVCDASTHPSVCFDEHRLCEVIVSMRCITRPEFTAGSADCSGYLTQATCDEQAACYYHVPSLKFRAGCRGAGVNRKNAHADAVCGGYTNHGRERCNIQEICHWTVEPDWNKPCNLVFE